MRIAVLTNDYPPVTRGGAGKITFEQVRMLESAGETVRVWPVQISWLKKNPWIRLVHHLFDLYARPALVREICAWQPDILITHNLTGCGFATPHVIQRIIKARWTHILHDVQLFEPNGQLTEAEMITPWQHLWSWLRRGALGQPDLIISPTTWLCEQHKRRGFFQNTVCEILPNPGLNPLVRRSRESRVPHRPPHLLFMGRVAKDKGADILLLLARSLPIELHVVGDGPCLTELRHVSPNVVCYGALTIAMVEAQLKAADILLVPSQIVENQPTVILEAAAFALPVIASDIGGIPETLDGAGILCAPQDEAAWIQAVQTLIDQDTYLRVSEDMERVAKMHDPAVYTQRLISLLGSKR